MWHDRTTKRDWPLVTAAINRENYHGFERIWHRAEGPEKESQRPRANDTIGHTRRTESLNHHPLSVL